jgi:ABC-2 type transport system permease protein
MPKLIVASIKMLYRDKQTLIYAIIFPLIFAVVFGLFDFNATPEIRVALVSPDTSPVSEAFASGFKDLKSFEVFATKDSASVKRKLREGEYDIVVEVPSGAGTSRTTPSTVTVTYDISNADRNNVALSAIRQMADALNLRMSGVTTPPVTIDVRQVTARQVKYYDFLLPGLVAMGIMQFAIIGLAVSVARYREQQILKRILATPLRPSRFLVAQVATRVLLASAQAGIILAVGVFMFGAKIYGNIAWMFILCALASLIFLNIAFAIAGRAANADAAQGLGQVIAIPMMFLSGVFFPTDTLPTIVQSIVKFLPLTPLIKALRSVALDGASLADTGTQIVQLAAWIVVSFLVASRLFSFSRA